MKIIQIKMRVEPNRIRSEIIPRYYRFREGGGALIGFDSIGAIIMNTLCLNEEKINYEWKDSLARKITIVKLN